MAASDMPGNWDPLKDHFKTSNMYRASKVVTRREGSESDASDEKASNLFIANIPSRITTDGLINLLGASGKIQEIRLVPDKKNPQNQLGFVKTLTSADGLRIIEQFHNFNLGNSTLKVHVQRPRKPEYSSDFGRPLSDQLHVPSAPLNSYPSLQPESFVESDQRSGGRLSSSSIGEDRMKPVGRSKLILATALRHQSQEPSVGQSRAGTRATNGSSHRSSQSGSSSDELGTYKQPESQRPPLQHVNWTQDNPSHVSKNVVDKVSPHSQVRETGPCLKCGNLGDKNCSKCKGIYCSKACQKDDYPFHQLICKPYNQDEDEFQKRFDLYLDSMTERGQEELQDRATVLPLNVPVKVVCLIPAITPSKFYVFPEENKEQLDDLSLRLNEHYAVEKNCQKPRTSPDIGDICACQYSADNLWYRAEVEDVLSRSKVHVRYVDYGNEEEVEVSRICELPREFKIIPKLVVLCGLAHIEPIPSDTGCTGWSKKAIQMSRNIIKNCVAMVTPVNVVSGVCYVEMKMTDGTDVAEMFIQAGVARYAKKNPVPVSSAEQLPLSKPLPSPYQLPSPRPITSPNQLPSSRPSTSPNQLPSSKPFPSAKLLPAASPTMESSVGVPNLLSYGWPADLSNLIGKKMSFQVVEYSPPGDLWVRIDPLPGRETMPLVRLSLTENYRLTPEPRPLSSCSNPARLTPTPEAAKPAEPKWHRVSFNDLPALQLKSEVKVEVTLPKNPAEFWCHDLEQIAPIIKLQNSLKPDDSPLPSSFQPEKGDICFGFYRKYNEWYRVMVSERKRDSIDAFLIDYGESISIPLNDVRPLPLELIRHPPMAFQCQLSVWSSLQTSSSDVVQHFQDLVQNKVVGCKILGRNATTGMHSVVLSSFDSGQSIASILIDAIEKKGF